MCRWPRSRARATPTRPPCGGRSRGASHIRTPGLLCRVRDDTRYPFLEGGLFVAVASIPASELDPRVKRARIGGDAGCEQALVVGPHAGVRGRAHDAD